MKHPDWLVYLFWALSIAALIVGARFRLSALLLAGRTPPGAKRMLQAARVLLLDAVAFTATCFVLKLEIFPMLMGFLLTFGLSGILLTVQWYFNRGAHGPGVPAARPGGAATVRSVQEGMQGLQDAALTSMYSNADSWIRAEFRKDHWRLGAGYQALMLASCLGLNVLNKLQGGWLYILFGVLWQAGLTGALYLKIDRKKPAAAPGQVTQRHSSGPGVPRPGTPGARPSSPRFPNFPNMKIPNLGARAPGGMTPGVPGPGHPAPINPASGTQGVSGTRGASGPPPGAMPRRKGFATRSDVQAMIAFSAGIWCGFFSRILGGWYGFASVTAFRFLLKGATPIASSLLGKMIPQSLQGPLQSFVKTKEPGPTFSLNYLRSREFWYGPGMGLVGGVLGGLIRHIIFNR